MLHRYSDNENIKGTEKPNRKIGEILGTVVLLLVLIYDTIFHKRDFDTVFDVGGKVVIIVLMLLFFMIYYIQVEKNDKKL